MRTKAKWISVLLAAALLTGCITVRHTSDTGEVTETTSVDTAAIVLCVQLIMTNTPTAIELARQIQDLFAEPDSPDKENQLALLMEQARAFLQIYAENQLKT